MTNIILTPNVSPIYAGQVLFVKRSADMQSTSDQIFTKLFNGTTYKILDIIGIRKTGAASVACLGGVYDAASKGGNPVVAATQSWVTLAANVNVSATLAALVSTALLSGIPYLSLSTGSTAACTADFFIFGYCVD